MAAAFVVVGAGMTAAKAAETLREEGFDGRVVLVGAEPDRPYERPPLSKGYLLGQQDRAAFNVHDDTWYAEHDVELVLGRRVVELDRAAHSVELSHGPRLSYDKLLLATGATSRRPDLPGADLERVHYLRSVADSERLGEALRAGGRVVVIGAGWIGLETAAAARTYGCEVTVLEPQPVPLQAALGVEMGAVFADLHRRHGVDLRLGRGVAGIRETGGGLVVATDDGDDLAADVVIMAVGASPSVELAERAGLAVDNGVLVDEALRTDDPDVYAAGDVANRMESRYGRRIRVEHWANALASGPAAARSMLGRSGAVADLPYFFTDQYELGMEFSGWFAPGGYDAVVTRGDVVGLDFQAFWLAGDRVVAAMHVNRWDDGIAPLQALVSRSATVDGERLGDDAVPLADVERS